MPSSYRVLLVVVGLSLATSAGAQDCGLASAPACNGTCSEGTSCAPATDGALGCECVAELDLTRLTIKLNFTKSDADTVQLNAVIPVPDGYTVAGRMVTVDVGGVARTFILDSKGLGKSDFGVLKLSVRAKKGVVAAQDGKLLFKVKGTFSDDLADEGLGSTAVAGATVEVPVAVTIDGQARKKRPTLLYKATQGKTGKAYLPK
jgi:hypothetical protein